MMIKNKIKTMKFRIRTFKNKNRLNWNIQIKNYQMI